MKKEIKEFDYIGGEGSLTKQEEIALTKYFAEKKNKLSKGITKKSSSKKSNSPLTT